MRVPLMGNKASAIGTGEMVPVADITRGTWTQVTGNGDAYAFNELDEGRAAFDDATTDWTTNTLNDILRVQLTSRTTPASPSTMHIRWRYKNTSGSTQQAQLRLFEGTTVRHTDVQLPGAAYTTADQIVDLTAVTNWANLQVDIQIIVVGNGQDLFLTGISLDEA